MVFGMAAARDEVTGLRTALAAAEFPEDRLGILADLTDMAAVLSGEGDEAAGLAVECLDETINGLTSVRAEFPAASDEGLFVLSLLAEASLLRDVGSDLDEAAWYLRDLQGLLPLEDPALMEVEFELGQVLIERCNRRNELADLDEIVATMTRVLGGMAHGDERRAAVLSVLALYRAARYGGLNGSADDRLAALSHAAEGLTSSGATAETTATCRVAIAWMTLTRQLADVHRSAWVNRARMEGARRGGPETAELLAADTPIDPEDARTALDHLDRVRQAAQLEGGLRELVLGLSCLAVLGLFRAGRFTGDVTSLAGELHRLAHDRPPDDLFRTELLGIRADLLAAQAERDSAGPEPEYGSDPAAEALQQVAAELPPRHILRPAVFDQLRRSFGRQTTAARTAEDAAGEVERLADALEQLPSDDPESARWLTVMAINVLNVQVARRDAVPLARLGTRLEQTVAKLAPGDPMRPIGACMYWSTVALRGAIEHRPELSLQAIGGLRQCVGLARPDAPFAYFAHWCLAAALADHYAMTGELRQLEQSRDWLSKGITMADVANPSPEQRVVHALMRYLRGIIGLSDYLNQREERDPARAVADLEQAADLIPADHALRHRVIADLQAARNLLAVAQDLGRDHPDFPSISAQAAAALVLQGWGDPASGPTDQAIHMLADVASMPGLTFRERPRILTVLGYALLGRYYRAREPRDLSNAINRLEEARRAVGQETASPYAALVLRSLAEAYRARGDAARGDVDRAMNIGLAALREHVGDVLLQATDEHALSTARRLITDAVEMARWSLGHDRPGPAIDALELGRGTVLHAATAGAGLADILRDSGHDDLADKWSGAAAEQPTADTDQDSDLRYKVMEAIEGSPAEARLLAPPPLADITAALKRRGIDALVYLLPRDSAEPGLAIIVSPRGVVTPVPLPGLQTQADGDACAYLRALRQANAPEGTAGEVAAERWRIALGSVCDWAWRTVIRPVLGAIPRPGGAPRRVVLVPTAELGLVPWHAAREEAGDGYRYACQDVIFSYAASARQFVDTARLGFRPWPERPVLISDAKRSLRATEIGICHLQAAFYPRAAVYGGAYRRLVQDGGTAVPGAAAATPEDVVGALPHGAADGASLLHFGGHGRTRVPVLSSRIELDNRDTPGAEPAGDSTTVPVRRILREARTRALSASGGLVVLASCLMDVTEADYDETLTLATAFLSAGAGGAVAARWRVPDAATACFMLTFHRYLNSRYPDDPAAALHATQLWMLDPGRCTPDDWPNELRRQVERQDLAGPQAWAGFTYQGR